MSLFRLIVVLGCLSSWVGGVAAQDAASGDMGAEESLAAQRSGFTFLLSLGLGYQAMEGSGLSESALGLSGLNLGIGGFLSQDLGLMFRISGTNVSYNDNLSIVSGVGAVTVQYWASELVKLELGPGFGIASLSTTTRGRGSERGFGLFAGAALSFWQGDGHSLQLGLEYAPAFLDGLTFHNLGITFGWQLL